MGVHMHVWRPFKHVYQVKYNIVTMVAMKIIPSLGCNAVVPEDGAAGSYETLIVICQGILHLILEDTVTFIMFTEAVLSASFCSWNEWVTLPVMFSDLPRNAQLALTVYDTVGPSKIQPVGGTTISLFGKHGVFRQV
jgi:hypothetical protein